MAFSVSMVIPCYNESERIAGTVSALSTYLREQHLNFEIIAVDDGSVDGTMSELQRISGEYSSLRVVSNGQNRGKGYSVKHGVQHSCQEVVIFTDADLSIPVDEIGRALHILETTNADVVIGSRTAAGAKIEVRPPLYRLVMGRAFALLIHHLLGLNEFGDTQCGFKAFRKEAADDLFSRQTLERFAFDVEILYLAKQLGYHVHELPITLRDRRASTVNPIRDSLKNLLDVMTIRKRHQAVPRTGPRD